jgi:hypothetical protein
VKRIHLVRSSDVGRNLLANVYNMLVQEDGPAQFLKEEHSISFHGQETALSWEMIFDKCTEYRVRYTITSDDFLILLTSKKNKENWFSSPDPKGSRSIFIDWTKDTNSGKSDSTKCDGEQAAIT